MKRRPAGTTLKPKVKILKTKFADMRAGQTMAIGTPTLIRELIKSIPKGKTWSFAHLRTRLAKRLKADVACPVTTAMYLRQAIESELESAPRRFSFPFWRAVSPSASIFNKLTPEAQQIILKRRRREGTLDLKGE